MCDFRHKLKHDYRKVTSNNESKRDTIQKIQGEGGGGKKRRIKISITTCKRKEKKGIKKEDEGSKYLLSNTKRNRLNVQ